MTPHTKLVISRLVQLAADGLTMQEAARVLGYTYQYVSKLARDNGIVFRRPDMSHQETRGRNAEICRRYLEGEVQAKLAEEFGITRERVRQIIERAGLVSETKRHDDFVAVVAGTVSRKGLTLSEASEMFNITKQTAYNYCRKHGVRPAAKTQQDIEELVSLAAEVINGKSIRQAAECDRNLERKLTRFLHKNKIGARGRSRHDDFTKRRELIAEWRKSGHTWPECAQKLSDHDRRPISVGGLVIWCRKHMPELFAKSDAA